MTEQQKEIIIREKMDELTANIVGKWLGGCITIDYKQNEVIISRNIKNTMVTVKDKIETGILKVEFNELTGEYDREVVLFSDTVNGYLN